jgi:DNA-binding PadR family transcriptional regulator
MAQHYDPSILILTSLAEGPKHGYLIMEDIEQHYSYTMGPGTLYGALKRLEDNGCIRALEGEKKRRPYELTLEGKKYLTQHLQTLDSIVSIGQRRLGLL